MRRALQIGWVVVQATWLIAIIPGHHRGEITIGDESRADGSANRLSHASCCDTPPANPGKRSPADSRTSHCAVCFFATTVAPYVPFQVDLCSLGFAGRTSTPVPASLVGATPRVPFDGRAPPLA